MKKRVLLGMSGGIDSSLSAVLLMQDGYEVIGATLEMWDNIKDDPRSSKDGIQTTDSISEAKSVAKSLGIVHHVIPIQKQFHEKVICNFIDEYMAGRTPNPCVHCNTHIKWIELLKKADELNCEYIATGHYANIITNKDLFFIKKAKDTLKDQSYFLWGLTQFILSRCILPLGNFKKDEIRELAAQHGFKRLVQKKESQEICFIHDNDYRAYLNSNIPDVKSKILPGNFVSSEGKVLGMHEGYPYYTIGQRKGLKIALGEPMYVAKIDAQKNEVTLGTRDQMYTSKMVIKDYTLHMDLHNIPKTILTKIRYRSEAIESQLSIEDDHIIVNFNEPVFAITPGQSAVLYHKDIVIGGGIIC